MVPNTVTHVQLPSTGSNTVYAYPNKIDLASDLNITALDPSLNPHAFTFQSGNVFALITPAVTATVNGVDVDTGASVTLNTPIPAGWFLDIRSNIPDTQTTSIKNQGQFLPDLHEEAFDRITRQLQDLKRKTFGFGIHGPDLENTAWPALPAAAQRAGGTLVFDQVTGLPTIGISNTQIITTGLLAPFLGLSQTSAETLALSIYPTIAIIPSALQYPEGDIRRYGATTSANDNSAFITAALAVSAAGGAETYLPAGVWRTTTAVQPVGSSSMRGSGQSSVLVPAGCDGIAFLLGQPTYQGSRFFKDFVIYGSNPAASSSNGITINLPSGRLTGIQFSNLTIENFAIGVLVAGGNALWNSSFTDCFLYNNYQGYSFTAGALVTQIRGGEIQTGPMAGSGIRYGIFTGLTGGSDTQSLHVQGTQIYQYDVGIFLSFVVYAVIENCDISVFEVNGIQIISTNSLIAIRDCWIQADSPANVIGINLADLGTLSSSRITIDSNQISGNASAGTVGIYCGTNYGGITITNNTIGAFGAAFVTGIGGITGQAQSPNMVIRYNSIYASTNAIAIGSSAGNAVVGPNTILNGATIIGGPPGGLMYFQPGMQGSASFTAATSVAVVLSPPMPLANYTVNLSGNAAGFCWVTGKGTGGFTINCSVSNSNQTDWSVSV